MQPVPLALGLAFLLAAGAASAQGAKQEGYDNPTAGTAPCLVLDRYETGTASLSDGKPGHKASAGFQNICGRALEVSFCFLYMEPVEDKDRACYAGSLRPYGRSYAVNGATPTRIAGPDYAWRYLPVQEAAAKAMP